MAEEAMPVGHLGDHSRKRVVRVDVVGVAAEVGFGLSRVEQCGVGCDEVGPRNVVCLMYGANKERHNIKVAGTATLQPLYVFAEASGAPLIAVGDPKGVQLST